VNDENERASGRPKVLVPDRADHGLVNYIDNKAKCRHLKKLTCKGTLRQVFIRVNRLVILSVI